MDQSYFSQNHEDINLTKEETEFLEKQFLKYLTTEMEKDSSTWKDFYDILKDKQGRGSHDEQKPSTSKNDTTKPSNQKGAQNCTNGQSPNADGGFKVNTEKTKQQYKHDSASSNVHSKWENSQQHQNFKQQYPKTSQTHETTREDSRNSSSSNNAHTSSSSSREKKENKKQNKRGKTSTKASSGTTKQKQQQQQQQQQPTIPSNAQNNRKETKGVESVLAIVKNVCIIFGCFVLMILVFLLKILWMVFTRMLKYGLIFLLYVVYKFLQVWSRLNERFQISQKVYHFGSSGVELFTLVTGINVKDWFARRRKKNATDDDLDNTPIVFPENSAQAIIQLLSEKDSRPYRALCVQRNATHEEIKGNYRKLARLVHPDKCELKDADEAFKILDTAFKKISDPEKREEVDEEISKERAWQQFNKNMGEEYKKMFDDIVNSLSCNSCNKRHKKNLVKERTFYEARYCGDCNTKHPANDGDVWVEESMLGLNWSCYACFDSEVFEVTEWGKCQNLKGQIPANFHKIVCRLCTTKDNSNGPPKRKGKKARKQRK